MSILLDIFIVFNSIFALAFGAGQHACINTNIKPKLKSLFGLVTVMFFCVYFALIGLIVLYSLVIKNYLALFLSIFIVLTFLIGKRVSYPTLKAYSRLQLLVLITSLVFGIYLVARPF